jgi:predicted PurR-regulated permease PerM
VELGKNSVYRNIFFVVFLLGLGYLMLRIVLPYIDVAILAFVIVQAFYPFYKWVLRHSRSQPAAITIATLTALTTVLGVLVLVAVLVVIQVGNLAGVVDFSKINWTEVQAALVKLDLDSLGITSQSAAKDIIAIILPNGLLSPEILNTIQQGLGQALGSLFSLAGGVVQGGFNLFFYVFVLVVSIAYLFRDFERLPGFLSRVSPLDNHIDKVLYDKFTRTTRAIVLGNFLVATVQASLMIIPLLWLGLDLPVLLWVIMLLFSLVPIGSGIVWIPVSISLILSGNPVAGIALLVYGTIVVNSLEATLRPYLLKDSVGLHPLVLIFSALGGISAFGPLGLLYGPLIAVFFASLMEAYGEQPAKIEHAD